MKVIEANTVAYSKGKFIKYEYDTVCTHSLFKNDATAKNETNDCVVKSIAVAFDLSYHDAHQFCKNTFGRKNRDGVFFQSKLNNLILTELKYFNKKIEAIYDSSIHVQMRFDYYYRNHKPSKIEIKNYLLPTIISRTKLAIELLSTKNNPKVYRIMRLCKKGTYIVTVRGHAFTIKDGVIYGNKRDGIRKTATVLTIHKIS